MILVKTQQVIKTALHAKYKSVAEDTLKIINHGRYTSPGGKNFFIKDAVDNSVSNSVLYDHDYDYSTCHAGKPNWKPDVLITNETVLEACQRLADEFPVALNFANATEPGGGFKRGAIAQEESIARSSALYESLIANQEYYESNKRQRDFYYTDSIIYSPQIPVIKNDDGNLLDDPYLMAFITAPAPMRVGLETIGYIDDEIEDKLESVISNRIRKILKIAADNNHRTIILGAWGCGAFGNDPYMVSECFREQLMELPFFDKIVFAIHSDKESSTYQAFEDTRFNQEDE